MSASIQRCRLHKGGEGQGAINPVLLRHTLFEDVVQAFLDGRKTALGTRVFIECWLIGK